MLFFVWYDDTPKKPAIDKIQEAIAAYVAHFQTHPNVVLVNAVDHLELTDILVRSERTIQPNTFWIGHEERMDVTTTLSE